MLKQYFSDCLLHIAILWSLFRIDPNNFSVPNNEILNYPEVQDILQGQTLAYMPTNFHNHFNTLNTIHGYAHPKHADNDIYHSALFRNLHRFRGVPTNIEAFLASSDITVNFDQPLQAGDLPPTGGSSIVNQNGESEDSMATSTAQANTNVQVDGNHNTVYVVETDSNPFPGLELCKEDLDLIEVLWRQDVDLGVSKDVFDPNLRRELQHERELEFQKERDERKEREKRQQERELQAQQWLTDNFVRDGETGEWMPIDGSGATSLTAGPSPPCLFPEPAVEEPLSFEEALSYVGELSNHSYVEPQYLHHQQQEEKQQQPELSTQLLSGNHSEDSEDFDFLDDFDETGISGYALQPHNQTEADHLNRTWQEVVNYISDIVSSTPTTSVSNNNNSDNTTVTMAPVDTQVLTLPAEVSSTPQLLHNQQQTYHHEQQQQQQQQQLNNSLNLAMLDQSQSQAVSSLASAMNETRHVLQDEGGNGLTGSQGDSGMLLHNVTLPVVPTALDSQLSPLAGATLHTNNGLANQDYNATNPDQDNLSSLDWVAGELFFSNITTDFDNLTSAIANSSMLDPSDLTSMLPPCDFDMNFNNSLDTVAMMEDTGSDSAISMGSVSPQQELNEAMESSPFDGLEGATGGSDYDSSGYGHRGNHTHSSSNTEDDGFHYSGSSYGSPASVNTNFSTGSNDTEHSTGHSATRLNHVNHNHTYPTQPGQTPREVKKYAKKEGPRQKGPHSRDIKRAQELKLPFSFERIVESPVEEFNDMITKTKLTEAQITLMRDIRRRGKNKVAAQNCRKRKLDVLFSLEDEMGAIHQERDRLREERRQMDMQAKQARDKYAALYDHIFRSLRDEHGQPYDPALFSLQQSSDGNVFLVRLNATSATSIVPTPPSSSASSPPSGSSPSSVSSRSSGRRKDFASSSSSSCSAQHKKKSKE